MEKLIEEFINGKGIPKDDELNKMADEWADYISENDLIRGLKCKADFLMGMIVMAKRWKKEGKAITHEL